MRRLRRSCALLAALLPVLSSPARASSEVSLGLGERVAAADAVLVGTVLAVGPGERVDGMLASRVVVAVEESLRGALPSRLEVLWPGGAVGDLVAEAGGFELPRAGERRWMALLDSPRGVVLSGPGSHRLLAAPKVVARADAALAALAPRGWVAPAVAPFAVHELAALRAAAAAAPAGGADWRAREAVVPAVVANAPGYTLANGLGTRQVAIDRGAMEVFVDADVLPTGITAAQGLASVQAALDAWTAISGARFVVRSVAGFGAPADERAQGTDALWLQLHDPFDEIPDASSTLGIGGSWRAGTPSALSGTVGMGGRVSGFDFNRSTGGYVVMEHKRSFFASNPTNFAEVLMHEIGHALGLAHSSENTAEADARLRTAIMFALAQGSGRGATPGDYDREVILHGYPSANRPAATWPLYLRAVTRTGGGIVPGTTWTVPVEDPEGGALTAILVAPASSTGSFVVEQGTRLRYTAADAFEAPEIAPSQGSFYQRAWVTYDDGAHRSAPCEVRVVALAFDQQGDGLPDGWMQANFGSPSPVAGVSGPTDDPDGDGYPNLAEYRAGTNPRDAGSPRADVALATDGTLTFEARAYDVYAVEQATSPAGPWTRVGRVQPTTSTGRVAVSTNAGARSFVRIAAQD